MMPRRPESLASTRLEHLSSDEYRAQQEAMHMMRRGYGGKGSKWADAVSWLCRLFDCGSVLDYGCGQGSLKHKLESAGARCEVREFDIGIPSKRVMPSFADLVVCTDVLEHIEPAYLGNTLNHICRLTRKVALLSVALDPSNKCLPVLDERGCAVRDDDGDVKCGDVNAHLIQKPSAWWEAKVDEHWLHALDLPDMPTPYVAKPEKRQKRWIAVVTP
jgi:hypothetical protein